MTAELMIRKLLGFCIAAAVLVFLAGCLQGQLLHLSTGESVRVPERIAEQNGIEESSEMVQSSPEERKIVPGSMPLWVLPVPAVPVLSMREGQSIFPVIPLLTALFLMSGCISRELVPRTSF
ncbi:MAG: hypothetical protein ACI4WR_08340 [Bulleidia sp.]